MAKIDLMEEHSGDNFDAVISVGTSSAFPYIVIPIRDARNAGKVTIEINPDDTMISRAVDVKIRTGAADTLDSIWKGLQNENGTGRE